MTLIGERDALREALREAESDRDLALQAGRDAAIVTERALALTERSVRIVDAARRWAADPTVVNSCMALMAAVEMWQAGQPS